MYRVEWIDAEGFEHEQVCSTDQRFIELLTTITEGDDYISVRWTFG